MFSMKKKISRLLSQETVSGGRGRILLTMAVLMVISLGGRIFVPYKALASFSAKIGGKEIELEGTDSGYYEINIGNDNNSVVSPGQYSVTVGVQNVAAGKYSVAVGGASCAYGEGSVALGNSIAGNSTADAEVAYYAFAAGDNNTAGGKYSVAMGYGSKATSQYSVAMGNQSEANGDGSVAFGESSVVNGAYGVAIGSNNMANGRYSVAMGRSSMVYGAGSVAFGNSTAGTLASAADTDYYSFAAGQSVAAGKYSVAMGNSAQAMEDNVFAFGGTVASGHTGSMALGYGAVTGDAYEVSVGNSSQTRRITNVTGAYKGASGFDSAKWNDTNTNVATGADVYNAVTVKVGGGSNINNGSGVVFSAGSNVALTTSGNTVTIAAGGGSFKADSSTLAVSVGPGYNTTLSGGTTVNTTVSPTKNITTQLTQSIAGQDAVLAVTLNPDIAVDSVTAGSVTADSFKVGSDVYISSAGLNANNKQITNVAGAGTLSSSNSNAATGADVFAATNMGSTAGKNYGSGVSVVAAVQSIDTKIGAMSVDGTYVKKANTISDNLTALDTQVAANTEKITALESTGITAAKVTQIEANATNITKIQGYVKDTGLDANSKQIVNVASAGELSVSNSNAATGADVFAATNMGSTAGKNYGSGVSVVAAVQSIDTKIGAMDVDGTYAKKSGTVSANLTALDTQVKTNTDDVANIKAYVTGDGLNAAGNVITNVKAGTAGTDAANLGQVQGYSTIKVNGGTNVNTGNGINLVAGDNVKLTADKNTVVVSAVLADSVNYDNDEGQRLDSVTFYDSEGKTQKDGGKVVSLKNVVVDTAIVGTGNVVDGAAFGALAMGYDNKVTGAKSTAVGTGNVVTGTASGAFGDPSYVYGSGSYSMGNDNTIGSATDASLGKDTFVLGSNIKTTANNAVVLGANSTATEDNVVSVGSRGNERRITNVAPAEKDTDAVNYKQHRDFADYVGQNLDHLSNEIECVGSMSAAMAGLHPSYTPGIKGQFAMAMGAYSGRRALAAGGFYSPNDKVMFSAGVGYAEGGSHMGNIGVTFALDRRNKHEPEKIMGEQVSGLLTKAESENRELKNRLAKQDAIIARQDSRLAKQDEVIARLLKKVNALELKGN